MNYREAMGQSFYFYENIQQGKFSDGVDAAKKLQCLKFQRTRRPGAAKILARDLSHEGKDEN